jgi:hypothetical protein
MLAHLIERGRESPTHNMLFETKKYSHEITRPHFTDDQIISNTYVTHELTDSKISYKFNLSNTADIADIKKIIIEKKDATLPIELDSIRIELGGQPILSIPYFLIEALHTITNPDPNTMVIEIDFAKYIHNILFLRLRYHEVKVFFIMKDSDMSNIQNISLITKEVILQNEARRRIAMASRYTLPIHQFETLSLSLDTPSTTNKIHLIFDGFSQGLFINLPI